MRTFRLSSMIQGMSACLAVFLLLPAPSRALEKTVLFREDFASLDNWKPFFFPKIKQHSHYTIERNGAEHVLKAESSASASGIVYKKSFNVYEYPRIRWRWKVKNVYAKANSRSKEGDDYPIRVYIMFEYDPAQARAFEKITYGLAKSLYGEYPPHSSLSYVWSSKDDSAAFLVSPYTDKAMMMFLEKGTQKAGTWQDEEVNILDDYRRVFGVNPPARARIAIMNDSDNTGESSVSFMEYIEIKH